MNKNTAITLNDRFSMLQKSEQVQGRRGRSRSRSRGRQQQRNSNGGGRLQGSRRNQALLDKLEKQHKMKLALNLKSKNILRSAGRAQGQIIRNRARRAATIKKAINPRNIRRNNLTTYVPLKDEPSNNNFRGRSRSRSRSRARSQSRGRSQSRNRNQQLQQQQQQKGSVLDRLGFQGRGRMRRGPQPQRNRSRSRVKLNRNNFTNNQQLKRSNSRSNLAPQRQQLRRTNSRNNLATQNNRGNSRARPAGLGGANQIRRRARNPTTQLNRPIGGRIVKKTARNVGQLNNNRRRGSLKNINRGNNGNVQNGQANRGRARQRNNGNNRQTGGNSNNARRARSRTRRGGANNGRGNGNPQISKAQLDKQLDDYMNKGSA